MINMAVIGRPNKYDTHIAPFLDEIGILRLNGVNYETIAKMLNISLRTLNYHKKNIEEFLHTIKKNNDGLILSLEDSLYNLARGNYIGVKSKTVYEIIDGKIDKNMIKSYEETKEYGKPELGAVIFSLYNLAPDKWKNKNDVNLEVNDEVAKSFKEVLHEENT